MPVVGIERMLTMIVEDLEPDAGRQPDQHVVVSAVPFVHETAATLQLPVLTENRAKTQLEPMLGSMAVAEIEHSALAFEVLVRIVQSDPE